MAFTGKIRGKTEVCKHLFKECLSGPLSYNLDWLENRQGELNIWAAGLRVTNTGKSSLDYRVRDRPEICEIICDLLDGLAETLQSLVRPTAPEASTSMEEADIDAQLDNDDAGSVFSAFSSDEDNRQSVSAIREADGHLSDQMFIIKNIFGQLTRISTAIRRSGAGYRHLRADESLKKEEFEEFESHLTVIVLMGSIEGKSDMPGAALARLAQRGMDQLTPVQKRLVHANIVRRNRMMFATKSMRLNERTEVQQQPQQLKKIRLPVEMQEAAPELPEEPVPLTSELPREPSRAMSIVAPSITETATEIGSQFKWQPDTYTRTSEPSVVTRVTRVAVAAAYPSCPKPVSDEFLQCPYCADLLPLLYGTHESRWRGHVSQDVLPYMCIFETCDTPDKMYLTSNELFEHMRNQHGVVRWVCDYCSAKANADQTFIFEALEDWESHMNAIHDSAVPSFQLPSLAKVSQRRMLAPLTCPLCGYAAESHHSIMDSHIAEHLHDFSLRSLPWNSGDNENNSANEQSADALSLSDLIVEDGGDAVGTFEDPGELAAPEHFHQLLTNNLLHLKSAIVDSGWPFRSVSAWQLDLLGRKFSDDLPTLSLSARFQAANLGLTKAECHPLTDLFTSPALVSSRKQSQTRMSLEVQSYRMDSTQQFITLESRRLDLWRSHLLKINHILYQVCHENKTHLRWGGKQFDKAFQLYCEQTRPSGSGNVFVRANKLVEGWVDLPDDQKTKFLDEAALDSIYYREYMRKTEVVLLEELSALNVALIDLECEKYLDDNVSSRRGGSKSANPHMTGEFTRRSHWPPPPVAEDKWAAYAKEYPLRYPDDDSDDEHVSRGTIDQEPILVALSGFEDNLLARLRRSMSFR